MADGTWSAIEMVRQGDWLLGADGLPVQAAEMDRVVLGYGIKGTPRRMMAMADGSILWSEEHGFWTADAQGHEWWWSASADQWRWEAQTGHIGGLEDNSTMREGDGFAFAHLSGWRPQQVVELSGYGPDTRLYLPRTNGVPIIVNGYVVGAGVNEEGYDYKAFRWNADRIAAAVARAALARVMAQTPTHASARVLADALA